ncbi:MAG: peptidoglycan DD-metalloendopeptidase family protein [Spirochaetes bacterium]|nr:peptidoglycan DD-metalloendopeptidase family protein [Spirochaetota bacterium]
MTGYLFFHLKISLPAFLILFLFLRLNVFSNKITLIGLYALVLKTFIPAGLWRLPAFSDFPGTGYSYEEGISAALTSASAAAFNPDKILFTVWMLVAALMSAYAVFSMTAVNRRLKKDRKVKSPELHRIFNDLKPEFCRNRRVSLHISSYFTLPFVWYQKGWLVIIPSSLKTREPVEIKGIISHELSHIRRFDVIKFSILHIMRILFFFSPFIHFAVREIMIHEEIETDADALRTAGIDAVLFADTILLVTESGKPKHYLTPAFTIFEDKRRLKMRLLNLFRKKNTGKPGKHAIFLCWITAMGLLFSFSPVSNTAAAVKNSQFLKPLKAGRITMHFGENINPITKKPYSHKGIDIAAPGGTVINAAIGGPVIKSEFDADYGYYIIISNPGGFETVYAHLMKNTVTEGMTVKTGDMIGTVGSTGKSTGPHLHFEIHLNGNAVNPENYINF